MERGKYIVTGHEPEEAAVSDRALGYKFNPERVHATRIAGAVENRFDSK